jgi:hypothetical protein
MNAANVAMIIISDNNFRQGFRQAGGNALAQTNVFRCTALQETGVDFSLDQSRALRRDVRLENPSQLYNMLTNQTGRKARLDAQRERYR